MGLISILRSFTRVNRNGANLSDVKTDPGGSATQTSEHFSTPGADAHPLPEDGVLLVSVQGSGRYSAAGYADPKNQQTAQTGDNRTYSRDPDSGEQVAQVWIKNDGTILVENDNVAFTLSPDGAARADNGSGFIELKADGAVDINGLTIKPTGEATSPVAFNAPSIVASGKELAGHDHNITSGSSAPGPTGANN